MSPNFIVLRQSPDWQRVAFDYSQNGVYEPSDFLPDPLPPSFPEGVLNLIELWNSTFGESYFACRASLNDIAMTSLKKSNPARLLTRSEFLHFDSRTVEMKDALFLFSDDDDWISQSTFEILRQHENNGAVAIRWPSLLLGDELINRTVENFAPRARLLLQRQVKLRPRKLGFLNNSVLSNNLLAGIQNQGSGFLFQTNNYALRGDFIARVHNFSDVMDHVSLSAKFMCRPYKILSLESERLSVTLKHPCSISRLARVAQSNDPRASLVADIKRFLLKTRVNFELPQSLSWASEYLEDLLQLFERILKSARQ